LKSKSPLIILVILTFLVVACGGGSQIAGTPTPEAKVETEPSPTDIINWDQAKDYIGASISVCGPVVGTNTDRDSQGNPTHAYLYIGKSPPDPDRFVLKIPGSIRTEFANRDPENYYLGKDICVTGLIKKGPQWSLPMIALRMPNPRATTSNITPLDTFLGGFFRS